MIKNKTIQESFTVKGIGLHSGKMITMQVSPAPLDSGIIFLRDGKLIPFTPENVPNPFLATSIKDNGVSISTVEHFLSVLYAMNINNLIIEVDGPELPVLDGSAFEFYKLLLKVGIREYENFQNILSLNETITVEEDGASIMIEPSDNFEISFEIDFDHPAIGNQNFQLAVDEKNYIQNIVAARTFGFIKDVEMMKSKGLALGGSLDNAVILSQYEILNPEGLRYPDECVRHKILDMIGDLSFLKRPLTGKIYAKKSGHKLNIELVKKIEKSVYF